MIKFLLLLSLCSFSNFVWGQWSYVITDPDEYTNVRKHPNANSKVLGKLTIFHIFSPPWSSCVFDGQVEVDENSNWLPVLINEDTNEVGYVYKKNIAALDNFPQLKIQQRDSLNVYFEDERLNVSIFLQSNVELQKELEKAGELDSYSYYMHYPYFLKTIDITSSDGEKLYMFPSDRVDASFYFLDRWLSCFVNDADLFNCPINLYRGSNDIYYLVIDAGDGGDVYSAIWIITKEKVVFDGRLSHCDFYNIVLDK